MFRYDIIGKEYEPTKDVEELLNYACKVKILKFVKNRGYDFDSSFKTFTNPKVDEYGDNVDSQFDFWKRVLIDYGIKYDLEDLTYVCSMTMVLKYRVKMGIL